MNGRFISKKEGRFFRINGVRHSFRENWRVSTPFKTDVPKKRQTALEASGEMAAVNSKKSGPDSHVSWVKARLRRC